MGDAAYSDKAPCSVIKPLTPGFLPIPRLIVIVC